MVGDGFACFSDWQHCSIIANFVVYRGALYFFSVTRHTSLINNLEKRQFKDVDYFLDIALTPTEET